MRLRPTTPKAKHHNENDDSAVSPECGNSGCNDHPDPYVRRSTVAVRRNSAVQPRKNFRRNTVLRQASVSPARRSQARAGARRFLPRPHTRCPGWSRETAGRRTILVPHKVPGIRDIRWKDSWPCARVPFQHTLPSDRLLRGLRASKASDARRAGHSGSVERHRAHLCWNNLLSDGSLGCIAPYR